MGGALASEKFAHGVHAHGVQPCSEAQCFVAALPLSTSVCARARQTEARGGAATSCHQSLALQATSWPWQPAPSCRKDGCAAEPPGIAGC